MGIKAIVSLYPIPEHCKAHLKDFVHLELSIPDYHPPSIKQVQVFLKFFREQVSVNHPVFIHCFAGCGRTGTLLAITELFYYKVTSASEAIKLVQLREPCSLDTRTQNQFVHNLAHWANLQYPFPPEPEKES